MIGQRLGSFEITGKLGEGGMGEVYRATDTRLDRQVAIKVLPQGFTEDKERLARFEREAKLLAQLNHPNIAQIYGIETSGEAHALVMELVPGPTLAERLESGPLSLTESLSFALQIAQALEEAHEKGIVHRDLKPQNIKASSEGKAKVLDFGLAKAMDVAGGAAASAADLARSPTLMNSPTLTGVHGTQLGVILGTAAYMAPEQARGGAVDKRADIWAFGVVFYEMLTGKSLFGGPTVSDTLAGVLKSEIDWQTLPAETPKEIRRLLRRCLERNPKNRLHDIADARIVLDDLLAGRSEDAAPSAGPAAPRALSVPLWRRILPWMGGAVAATAIAAIAAALLPRGTAPVAAPSAAAAKIRTLVSAGVSLDPAVSPDGRTLAFESTRDGESRIWIKDLTSGSESVLVRRTSYLPEISPDGTSVLFVAESESGIGELFRVSLATREERLVARQVGQGTWAPDGRSVLLLRNLDESINGWGELVAVDLESGREQVLHRDSQRRMLEPRWSPDGKRVAVALGERQVGLTDGIGLLDAASGAFDELPVELAGQPGGKVRGLRWISPHRLAILVLDNGETVTNAGRVALLDVERRQLTSLLPLANVGWGIGVAGPESLIVGVGSTDQNLHEVKRDAQGRWSEPAPVTEGPFRDRQPVYSPDGRWILFTSNRSGNLDVWRRDRTTGEIRRLTDHEAEDWDPALSPDGRQLLFSSNRSGRYQIWIAESDGSSPTRVTDFENAQNPTMSPDGAWISFVRQDAGENDGIWKIHPDGSGAEAVALGDFLVPDTSPDGRYVAMSGQADRKVARLADGVLLKTGFAGALRFRWSVERGTTYLWGLVGDETGGEIHRVPLDAAREEFGRLERVLAAGQARNAETFGVARDGSAVTFATLANRRAQLIRIDGLTGLSK